MQDGGDTKSGSRGVGSDSKSRRWVVGGYHIDRYLQVSAAVHLL